MSSTYRHADPPAFHDHVVDPDPEKRASSDGPVTVCMTCAERVVPTDLTGAILDRHPNAIVTRSQFDGGVFYEVKVLGRYRTARLGVEWGDDEGDALTVILDRLGSGQ